MIRETVEIARETKRLYPDVPVVLGGWHPSLLPHQTLAAPYVDVVVKGQGEEALLEIVQRIEARENFAGIEGAGYKEDGRLVFNNPRALKPIVDMPPNAYHIADFDAYERVCGRRWTNYVSSFACPYNCSYCTNAGVYGRKWNALPPDQVGEELTDLVTRYRLELVWIIDDNYMVDRARCVKIAEEIVRRGAKFRWSTQASINLVLRFTPEELKLLQRSGLDQVQMGADSGSPELMHLMNKDFQSLEMVYQAAERLTAAGVKPAFNMIFGYPGEEERHRKESVDLIMNICRTYPRAEFCTNIFTPYPGAPVMERAFELGIQAPDTMEGWADFFPRYQVLPWLKGKKHAELQIMRDYLRIAFNRIPVGRYERSRLNRTVYELIAAPARWRLDHSFFRFPVELWARNFVDKVISPPKAIVDPAPLAAEPVTC
jgi:radical SAM superfamily enzyme YgiQ (UPF0313 family)